MPEKKAFTRSHYAGVRAMPEQDWFEDKPGPEQAGTSNGGSPLFKYANMDDPKPFFGFLEEASEFAEARERVYEELFGKSDSVFHEILPLVPHIDVYVFPPNDKRDFYTFVTGGMSDLPMNAPAELGPEYRRVEIVFYASEYREEYAGLLRSIAHFVHDYRAWLHWGHTMPNGQPPQPLFGTKHLDAMLFTSPIIRPDALLGEKLLLDSEPVNLLWLVPITTAECELKLEQGADALYDLLDARNHPHVFTGERESYV